MKSIKPILLNKKNIFSFLVAIIIVFVLIYLNERNMKDNKDIEENIGPYLNKYAPNFETEYINGSEFVLNELRGTPIILNFWATWCPPCVREMPLLQKYYDEHKSVSAT